MTPVNRNNFPVILHNTAPMYLTFPKLFSHLQEEALASDLIEHLDSIDNPRKSGVSVTNDTLIETTLDYKLSTTTAMSQEDEASWFSKKNQLAKRLHECCFALIKMIDATNFVYHNSPVDQIDGWDTFWIRKYTPRPHNNKDDDDSLFLPILHHDFCIKPEGYNDDPKHQYATPDMASMSIALNDGSEYEGGEIVISNGFNIRTGDYEEKTLTKMNTGDGILWNGWTEHGINPVTKGARYVLIVHFTGVLKSS